MVFKKKLTIDLSIFQAGMDGYLGVLGPYCTVYSVNIQNHVNKINMNDVNILIVMCCTLYSDFYTPKSPLWESDSPKQSPLCKYFKKWQLTTRGLGPKGDWLPLGIDSQVFVTPGILTTHGDLLIGVCDPRGIELSGNFEKLELFSL